MIPPLRVAPTAAVQARRITLEEAMTTSTTDSTTTTAATITDAPFHPSLAVADLAEARTWYAEKLGWEPIVEPPGTLVYQVGDRFSACTSRSSPGPRRTRAQPSESASRAAGDAG